MTTTNTQSKEGANGILDPAAHVRFGHETRLKYQAAQMELATLPAALADAKDRGDVTEIRRVRQRAQELHAGVLEVTGPAIKAVQARNLEYQSAIPAKLTAAEERIASARRAYDAVVADNEQRLKAASEAIAEALREQKQLHRDNEEINASLLGLESELYTRHLESVKMF